MKNLKSSVLALFLLAFTAFSLFFAANNTSFAQSGSVQLSLDSASSVTPGSSIDLTMRISSSQKPASFQWDLNYNPDNISSITWKSTGSVITSAGKSVTCNTPSAGVFRCLALGFNTNTINDGIVGTITVNVSSAASGSVPINFSTLIASDASGNNMSISGTGGTISTSGGGSSDNLSVSCDPSATFIYAGKKVTWHVRATGGGDSYEYTWSGSEGLEGSRSSATVTYYNPGQKTASVRVTSGSEQVTVQCGTVSVNPPPVTGWCAVRVSPVSSGDKYKLTWSSGLKSPVSTTTRYNWSGTDGLESTRSSVSKTYPDGGLKTAAVTMTSGGKTLNLSCNASILTASSIPDEDRVLGGRCTPTVSDMVVKWKALGTGGTGEYSYVWSGTDGFSTTSDTASYRYLSEGTKSAAVTINSGNQSLTLACEAVVAESGDESSGSGGGDGCFIATAAYGTEMEPEVEVLRNFRDETLIPNPIGNALVGAYYKVSPGIADVIREHDSLKSVVRIGLKPIIIGLEAFDYDK